LERAVGNSVEAGGYAGTFKIKQVWFYRTTAGVVAETPQGGFNGPSCGDLDAGAGAERTGEIGQVWGSRTDPSR
jgi:hypothetical protein